MPVLLMTLTNWHILQTWCKYCIQIRHIFILCVAIETDAVRNFEMGATIATAKLGL
jgi:hypothetical protein